MLKVSDVSVGLEAEGTFQNAFTASKKLHPVVHYALSHSLKPTALDWVVAHKSDPLLVNSPDLDSETLFAHAYESLASASVMAGDFAGRLQGPQRKMMLALQQVIMLGELALNRVRNNVDRVPGSGVTEPAEGALRAKEDGHRGSWLTLSLRRPNTHQRNHDDQAHYRIDRVG